LNTVNPSFVPSPSATQVVHAAGGLLWRTGPDGLELALIRRMRHGEEWSLPKGKLDPGESWEAGAAREVSEETGCEVRLGSFAGGQIYLADSRPKVVLYWHMECLQSGGPVDLAEVLELAWLNPAAATDRLTHETEQRLVCEAMSSAPQPIPGLP
jgi:ADP-ribose pyrophosphatase YjhB (NUDIX family)